MTTSKSDKTTERILKNITRHLLTTIVAKVRWLALLPLAAGLFVPSRAQAANGTDTWVGNTSANFGDSNWSGANNPPLSGDSWLFGAAGSSGTALNNNLTAGNSVAGITFNSSAAAFTVTNNSITLTGGITNSSAQLQTLNFPIAATTVNTITMTTGGGNVTLGGNISGTGGGLSLAGTGTLTLSGNNSFTGGLAVNSTGKLQLQANANNTANGITTVMPTQNPTLAQLGGGSGGTIQLRADSTVASGGVVSFDNAATAFGVNSSGARLSGTFNFDVNNLTTGTGQTLQLGPPGAVWTVGTGSTGTSTTFNVTGGNGYALQMGTLSVGNNYSLTFNPSTANVIVGPINNGSTGGITKTGAGKLTLSSSNSMSGGLTIDDNSGIVAVTSATGLGTGPITIGSGAGNTASGELQLSGGLTITTAGTIKLAQSRNNFAGGGFAEIENLSGANSLNSNLSINGAGGAGANILSTAGTLTLAGNLTGTAGGTRTYDFSGSGNSIVTGTITNGSSTTIAVQKDGTGTLTLSGSGNTYSGTTTINSGAVLANGIIPTNTTSVAGGAILGGTGTILGPVSCSASALLQPGGAGNSIGTLSISNNLTLAGNTTATFSLNSSGASSQIAITNSLVLSGNLTVALLYSGTIPAGNYPLMSFASRSGAGTVSLDKTYGNLTLETNATSIYVTVGLGGSTSPLTWVGDGTNNAWDFSTANWNNGVGSSVYADGLGVLFNDTGSASPAIALNTIVQPLSVTFNNSAENYTLGGTGSISGATTLALQGTGTVTLTNVNHYTGATTVSSGSLVIGNAGQLGGGNYAANLVVNGAFTYASSAPQTLGGVISGAGSLKNSGTGLLTLSGPNTYSGATVISSGILSLSSSLALQNSPLDTLDSIAGDAGDGLQTTVATLTLGGLTGGQNLAAVFTTTSGGYGSVTALTLNPGVGATPNYSGGIADGATGMTLTKSGAGTQTLSGTNTYTGATTVNAGTLALLGTNANLSASTTVTVVGGANLLFGEPNLQNATANYNSFGLNLTGQGADNLTSHETVSFNGANNNDNTYNLPGNIEVNNGVQFYAYGINNTINFGGTFSGTGDMSFVSGGAGGNTFIFSGNSAASGYAGKFIFYAVNPNPVTGKLSGGNNTLPTTASVKLQPFSSSVTASLDLNGNSQQLAGLSDSGTAGAIVLNSGAGTPTLTISSTAANTFSGVLGTGGTSFALTITGPGTQTLSGASTYTGNTTVSGGTLALTGTGSIANSTNIIVQSPGTLDVSGLSSTFTLGSAQTLTGNGAVNGSVTINDLLYPGNGGIGTLTFSNNLTLNATSTNWFVVTTFGGASNQVAVLGTLSPNSSVVEINTAGDSALGVGTNVLFTYPAASAPLGSAFTATPVFDTVQTGAATNALIVDDGVGDIELVVTNPASGPVVSSDASLNNLVVLASEPPTFVPGMTNYYATNFSGVGTVTILATNNSAFATDVLYLNGVALATNTYTLSNTVPVGVGNTNLIMLVVTAQDGMTTSNYFVTVTELPSTNAYLLSLALNPSAQAGLTSTFVSNTFSYSATNAYGYTPTVTVVNADLTATDQLIYSGTTNILVSGVASTTPTLTLSLGVTNVVQVQVTAQDGATTQTYTVNIVEQPSLTVPHLTNSVSGNNLNLTWPGDHLGYRLLVQTNNQSKGISTNAADWGTVAGSTAITSTNFLIPRQSSATNEFYRLVYP